MSTSDELHTISVTSLSHRGEGVGKDEEGRAVFIPYAAPGDRLRVRDVEQQKTFWRGEIEDILEASTFRVEPKCSFFGRCGGCAWQHVAFSQQLASKREHLREALRKVGQITYEDEIELFSAQTPWQTRTRTRLQVDRAGRPAFFARGSNERLTISSCPVLVPVLDAFVTALHEHPLSQIEDLQEISLLASSEGELAVALHLKEGKYASSFGWRRGVTDLLKLWRERGHQVAGVSIVSGLKRLGSLGSPWFDEGDPAVRIRPEGFSQASHTLNRVLVEQALGLVDDWNGRQVLEIYAGSGNFSLSMAAAGAHVLALESHPLAVEDAQEKAEAFPKSVRPTFRVFRDDKFDLKACWPSFRTPPEVLFVDPPRRGIHQRLRKSLKKLQPPVVCMVSCVPATFARDLRFFVELGYEIETIKAVDLMPHTTHLESMALLRKKPAS